MFISVTDMIDTSEPKMSSAKISPKKSQKLSFSISSILGKDTDRKSSVQEHDVIITSSAAEAPRVPPIGTVHHYAISGEYSNLDISGHPRACSTPENEDYPSPTPTYHPIQHGNHVPYPYPLYHTSPSFVSHAVPRLGPDSSKPTLDIPLKSSVNRETYSDKSLDSLGESYEHSPSPLKMKKKKTRTVFSRSQIYQLESAFDLKRYLSSTERSGLAARLHLSETQIKIWFQNRRNKWKRQINGEMDEIPIPPGFAAGFLSQQPYCPPSLNSVGHVMDASEELLRSRLTASSYYAHPYSTEHRRAMPYLH